MLWRFALPLALALASAGPVAAQDTDLELVLLADASGSIDAGEIAFQRSGYAEAITDPEVLETIMQTAYGSIAVTYVEWAANQAVVVPWRVIDGPDSAAAFAAELTSAGRAAFGRNAIGDALLFGKSLIENNALDGWRKVIDFSGDSANSYGGAPVSTARDAVVGAGITINGLPILCRDCRSGQAGYGDLEAQYRDRIIGGVGAFVVTADSRDSFADAVKRKLILEISGQMPVRDVADAPVAAPRAVHFAP
ncbi:hypothetical protein DKT77_05065 [Meridianimarinicoccus roseus]|uniref:DUF1194 domain-containing protein n=1 Tax=Meridianimarinicoccus roseus TaxID=2072018 RepID=A0A2V2LJT7_9RHOB|nr:hypothetical protein DKT77_05065 [Meridianimarinicoccus roseus]